MLAVRGQRLTVEVDAEVLLDLEVDLPAGQWGLGAQLGAWGSWSGLAGG